MIKVENIEVSGLPAALRGMRNPLNSWDKSDSGYGIDGEDEDVFVAGPVDLALADRLIKAGTPDRKFLRMIHVSADVTAPLYWWKEYDTYKVATVANSCSTMHTIHKREFTRDDFSFEKLESLSLNLIDTIIRYLNSYRNLYVEFGDKEYWYMMIQLLPSSYNQRRTVDLNYETLRAIYHSRKNHKLDEWREFCRTISGLPYANHFITDEIPSGCDGDSCPINYEEVSTHD